MQRRAASVTASPARGQIISALAFYLDRRIGRRDLQDNRRSGAPAPHGFAPLGGAVVRSPTGVPVASSVSGAHAPAHGKPIGLQRPFDKAHGLRRPHPAPPPAGPSRRVQSPRMASLRRPQRPADLAHTAEDEGPAGLSTISQPDRSAPLRLPIVSWPARRRSGPMRRPASARPRSAAKRREMPPIEIKRLAQSPARRGRNARTPRRSPAGPRMAKTTRFPSATAPTPFRMLREVPSGRKRGCTAPPISISGPDWLAIKAIRRLGREGQRLDHAGPPGPRRRPHWAKGRSSPRSPRSEAAPRSARRRRTARQAPGLVIHARIHRKASGPWAASTARNCRTARPSRRAGTGGSARQPDRPCRRCRPGPRTESPCRSRLPQARPTAGRQAARRCGSCLFRALFFARTVPQDVPLHGAGSLKTRRVSSSSHRSRRSRSAGRARISASSPADQAADLAAVLAQRLQRLNPRSPPSGST